MLFYPRYIPGLAIGSYLVGDEKSGEAVVIDPTRDVQPFVDYARLHGLHIRHIVETHVHADFVCGSRELKATLGDKPIIHCSSYGGEDWTQPYADRHVTDGDTIEFGNLKLGFMHTPGHTPEHIMITLYDISRSRDVPWLVFTGDFLFVGDVGRPDLLGEEAKRELAHELYNSVFDRLPGLPDITEIFPAHGAGSLCGKALGTRWTSTVGFERQFNRALVPAPEAEWVQRLMDDMPLAPPYFLRMKQVNKEGPAILGGDWPGQQRLNTQTFHDRVQEDFLVLDTRSKEAFAAAHIPGAVNIPLADNLSTWAGWILPYDRPTLLVLDEQGDLANATTQLLRVGFDDVQGYLEGGMDAWETSGLDVASVATMSVHDMSRRMSEVSQGSLTLVDVRTENEWNGGHIDGAIHIHAGKLGENLEQIPRDKPVAVMCGSGYRASIASSLLRREGYDNVANVIGGMAAWKAASLPVVSGAVLTG